MKKVLPLLLLAACSKGAGPAGSPATLTLTDAAETTPLMSSGKAAPDLESISFASDGTTLEIRARYAGDILEMLTLHNAGLCGAEVNIDRDGNETTGGLAWENPRAGGFEIHLRLQAGIHYEGGGFAIDGGVSGRAFAAPFPTYTLIRCADGEKVFDAGIRRIQELPRDAQKAEREEHEKASRIEGRDFVARIPYAELGVAPGETLRLRVRECFATGTAAEIFLPEGRLTLK